ncbi:MAG TPA: hypothetical protein VN958_18310, partial [Chitinophagaceae bacterium]|nr:hypothetical protein [Chitinophagaceae bacterium]
FLLLSSLSLFLLACSSSKKTTKQSNSTTSASTTFSASVVSGDGLSYETAIVIDAKNERAGVDKEYEWLRQNYPGYILNKQSLNYSKHKPYDIIDIKTADGVEKKIYFDISGFFGKF